MHNAPRLRSLEDRHATLDAKLSAEALRPKPDEAELARLKKEKLRLKEEMERLRSAGSA
ncbi:YdcH family protein [Roseomonas elaeocarpi]|uniref:YdcH family protein n=1 Tax=Roseomonas elaeocarpi TaxID=907779 RepID=A0ABV6JXL4_9PROT